MSNLINTSESFYNAGGQHIPLTINKGYMSMKARRVALATTAFLTLAGAAGVIAATIVLGMPALSAIAVVCIIIALVSLILICASIPRGSSRARAENPEQQIPTQRPSPKKIEADSPLFRQAARVLRQSGQQDPIPQQTDQQQDQETAETGPIPTVSASISEPMAEDKQSETTVTQATETLPPQPETSGAKRKTPSPKSKIPVPIDRKEAKASAGAKTQVPAAAIRAEGKKVKTALTIPTNLPPLSSRTPIRTPSGVAPEFIPKDPHGVFNAWSIGNSQTKFVSTTGDISSLRFLTKNMSPMIVNAANKEMTPGMGGTNASLTRAVNMAGWANSTEGKTSLQVCECTAGEWINPNGKPNPKNGPGPQFLAQLLGPTATELNSDAVQCYFYVREAYLNCYKKAMQLGSHMIQLPLLSSFNFAPLPEEERDGVNLREAWLNAAEQAFADSLTLFAQRNPDYPLIVVMTNLKVPIF
ncbi:hypothetical protein [Chlamydia vaughanii]|uniref:hypothetical protein n=1 Tax=Chlamydia vaughanii TaxID=3112552 RepID=UPI0032B12EF1